MADVDVTPSHLAWIVSGRSANQQSTMDLYDAIYANQEKLNRNPEHHEAAQELTGIAFSLWRAVFLSDTTGEFADQTSDVTKFLATLISDNTVLYVTDKNARNWSFRYYLDNATYRLSKLATGRLGLVAASDLQKPASSEKDEWQQVQGILDLAVRSFGLALSRLP